MLTLTLTKQASDDGQTILHATVTADGGMDPYVFVITNLDDEGWEFSRVASGADLLYVPSPTSPTPTTDGSESRTDSLTVRFNNDDDMMSFAEALDTDVSSCEDVQTLGLGGEEEYTTYFYVTIPDDSAEVRVREYLTRKDIAPYMRRRAQTVTINRLTVHARNTQDQLQAPLADSPLTRGKQ